MRTYMHPFSMNQVCNVHRFLVYEAPVTCMWSSSHTFKEGFRVHEQVEVMYPELRNTLLHFYEVFCYADDACSGWQRFPHQLAPLVWRCHTAVALQAGPGPLDVQLLW